MLIRNSVKTTATVYNIEQKYDYDNAHNIKNKRCIVYYKYNVDEMEYKAVTEGCKYSVSDEFTIYYSKTNPTKISKNRVVVLLIGILISLIVLVANLFQQLKPINHEEVNKDIKIKKIKVKTKKKVKK